MPDTITLTGLAITACHGVLDFEKQIPQPFVVDLSLEADLAPAGRSDDLTASLSYADVAARVVEVASGEPVDLIETLAERIADAGLEWAFVEAVDVMVRKPHAPAGVPFTPTTGVMAGPAVSVRRERRRAVVIAMGTNLGRRVATMRSALESLRALDGLDVVHVSPLVETDPVGGVEQPDYLNAVVVGFTRLTGEHLLAELHRIEAEHGRRRDVRWGARTLDLDIISLGTPGESDEVRAGGERDGVTPGAAEASKSPLALPHPRAHERAFVVVPWWQAAPWMTLRTPEGVVALDDHVRALDVAGVRRGPVWDAEEYLDLEGGLR
ncbi:MULTISPECIES: 2-amino-4-hydroxy-6-hydroxymethyldihydropteridine diphosphokinase [Dermacoccus]|uniref:Bifunctional folate synthesis protein n=2 Tax=Dermacoccus TaxID=57495 RepID=A0A417YWS5_9MICO|nr:2-amino-4-hydroxy-6-hydroxymethyldihydropteridine diphosphokinase [Dermacoccus abyssi]RHW41938.1 2-amino-4-hydroxy-6-hydroxymethyldihydropteridine diphosphokinase [Dermacoccus abyssi]